MSKPRPLGPIQLELLKMLTPHSGWRSGGWHPGCGWIWDTVRGTARILDTLVARGLASVEPYMHNGTGKYSITNEGKAVLEAKQVRKPVDSQSPSS